MILLVRLAFVLALAVSHRSAQVDGSDPAPLRDRIPSASTDCSKASSELRQLVAAPDKDTFGAQHGLAYAAGQVRVVVALIRVEEPVPQQYGLEIEARFDNFVQGMLAIDELCDLASDAAVQSVESPRQ